MEPEMNSENRIKTFKLEHDLMNWLLSKKASLKVPRELKDKKKSIFLKMLRDILL